MTRLTNQWRFFSADAAETDGLGMRLGRLLIEGDVVCLSGDLGAGKTVLARGIGKGWGARPALTSPTYNLAHEHKRRGDRLRLYHIDLYRIGEAAEAPSLGFDDILDSGDILIIEWAERIRELLPRERLRIRMDLAREPGRMISARAWGSRHLELLKAWRQAMQAET